MKSHRQGRPRESLSGESVHEHVAAGEAPPGVPGNAPRGWPRCFRLLLLALVSLFGLASARADIQLPTKGRTRGERQVQKSTPPPSPVAVKVRLQPGGHAEIVLQATGSLGKTVEFLLRTPPAHGAFEGVPRRISQDRIALMYVHRAADGPGHDAFTFAAQTLGGAVSAAGTVDIEIIDDTPPPALPSGVPDLAATPAELDFGAVEAGRSSGVTLTLENRGGQAIGRLDPPAPWAVDGDASYRLEHGGRQLFRVVFRPQREGSFAETLRVEADGADSTAGCVVRLIGTGLAAARPFLSPSPAAETLAAATPAATPVNVSTPAPVAVPVPDAVRPVRVASDPSAPATTAQGANEAQIKEVAVRAVGTTNVELAWKPPVPLPRSYRVERRSFAHDESDPDGVRIDWRLYERTEFRVRADQVTATLRGLIPGEPITVRVESVNAAGQLSAPSPEVGVTTIDAPSWWRPTPLKGLLSVLAVCLGLIARRRWQEYQLVRELDARHMANEEDSLSYAPK